VVKIKI